MKTGCIGFCFSRLLDLIESFWLCRIVGAVFIMLGLYLVLWGKNEERKLALEESQQDPESLTKHLLEAQHKKSNSESEV